MSCTESATLLLLNLYRIHLMIVLLNGHAPYCLAVAQSSKSPNPILRQTRLGGLPDLHIEGALERRVLRHHATAAILIGAARGSWRHYGSCAEIANVLHVVRGDVGEQRGEHLALAVSGVRPDFLRQHPDRGR